MVGNEKIAELWRKYYKDLFNSVHSNIGNVKYNVSLNHDIIVGTDEVCEAICKLDSNKSSGAEKIYAEHLKNASLKIVPLLSICITGLFIHGILPNNIISVNLVPVIKDKTDKINCKDNFS